MDTQFQQVDFGPLKQFLDNDDVTDISYSNGGQVWLKTLSKGVYRVENTGIDNTLIEKIAFQCANTMGKSFNMANPFLDAESAELRLNFVHDSIARNGVALLARKTPAKIRLKKDEIIKDDYIRLDIHDFLLKCVEGHCNILVSGETGSGKTEFIKYLASHTKENEKLITIEDTLELHLDRIFPHRDIVAMKTNNIASYSDVLVTCMRQNPRWILLSEVRSAEAVMAVRNSISSGHNILSTIHADKAASIPSRLYSLLESNLDLEQFLRSIHRYVQLGVHIKGYYSKERQKFHREIAEVTEFYVTEDNEAKSNTLYRKTPDGKVTLHNPSKYLLAYLESQGVIMQPDILVKEQFKPMDNTSADYKVDNSTTINNNNQIIRTMPNQYNNRQVAYQPQPMNPNIVKQLNNQVYNQTRQMAQNTQYRNTQTRNMHQFNNNIQPQIPNQFPNGQVGN
jgi:pilus assembly protein CpaF